ncbi:hypothetical protein GQ607_002274 [Colletotrichum asianum]|uniref:Uncharacterized protein n=2 Tax=Colletotrichum gloeosporioides species complex TaxID=2707338 RepID=A0A8H3WPI1_9PEZI|nr:hypothetical protein GQ607_002274 [Colletotrichum asianum]
MLRRGHTLSSYSVSRE